MDFYLEGSGRYFKEEIRQTAMLCDKNRQIVPSFEGWLFQPTVL